MNIPTELLALGLTCIGGLFSIAIHILLRMDKNITIISARHGVDKTWVDGEIASLKRHTARNEAETARLQKHIGLLNQHHRHPEGA